MFALAIPAAVTIAQSQESIGIAITIRNEVNGTVASRTFPINSGESVFRQEVVATRPDSSAKIVFADNTNLAIGPDSSVTLDKFVFAGANDYRQASIQLVRGAFRFTTGNSEKRAYEIKTDVATIGVRGTMFDMLIEPLRTVFRLQRQPQRPPGRVSICNNRTFQCLVVSSPGETVVVTETTITNEGVGGGAAWSFASVCANPNDAALCEVTTLASNQPAQPTTTVTSPQQSATVTSQPTTTVTMTQQPATVTSQPTTTVTTTQQPTTATASQPTTTVTASQLQISPEFGTPLGLAGALAGIGGVAAAAVASATSQSNPISP